MGDLDWLDWGESLGVIEELLCKGVMLVRKGAVFFLWKFAFLEIECSGWKVEVWGFLGIGNNADRDLYIQHSPCRDTWLDAAVITGYTPWLSTVTQQGSLTLRSRGLLHDPLQLASVSEGNFGQRWHLVPRNRWRLEHSKSSHSECPEQVSHDQLKRETRRFFSLSSVRAWWKKVKWW